MPGNDERLQTAKAAGRGALDLTSSPGAEKRSLLRPKPGGREHALTSSRATLLCCQSGWLISMHIVLAGPCELIRFQPCVGRASTSYGLRSRCDGRTVLGCTVS
jgi:hypothetical protein